MWRPNALNENKITHYAPVVNMWSISIVKYCACSENLHIHDCVMANSNKLEGGHQMLVGDNKVLWNWPWLPQCAPDAPLPLPSPNASSLNNFSALSERWHLVAYFLSYPFISCHFFLKHLKLQWLKGIADGWSNRHSAAQWTQAASRAEACCERRAGL